MLQITPQMKIFVATEPADFRCGIDGLGALCRSRLGENPLHGAVFVFRNRRKTSVKILAYDGQGFWLFQKRFSSGTFKWWPESSETKGVATLAAHELHILLYGGDPGRAQTSPMWRSVQPLACDKRHGSKAA